jgi:hypothetical protein
MIDAVSELPPFQQSNGYISGFFFRTIRTIAKTKLHQKTKRLAKAVINTTVSCSVPLCSDTDWL